ncbi:hypothetical protein [Amycolatopsis sp. YIM 10]|uniref:hypothetical protein n=1 Tax=Amycolatopsis sp. YIM 10 TaxID=2653857 RepID=UPI00128FF47E|nr:hypothetical protein [Amycolatopsis sp. YIM 10]QFU86776.1 hypothetical protein YIM_07825 [Amycolatopsis sp. YIM 10]
MAALRKLIGESRFDTLGELSDHIPGRPGKRRLSELARGTGKFPELHEVTALVETCDPGQQALAKQGDLPTLTARANNDDTTATRALAQLLTKRGDVKTLTARANNGDEAAAQELAQLLTKRGAARTDDELADGSSHSRSDPRGLGE